MTLHNPYQLTTEAELPSAYEQHIHAYWQQYAQPEQLISPDGLPLHYVSLLQPAHDKAIILLSGRTESYMKFRELAYDLGQQGYSLYILDHRGQGRSGRLLSDPHKGHIDRFQDYVSDTHHFIEQVVRPRGHRKLYLLAHSMGCTISALYLQTYPGSIQAAVLASPMLGINLGKFPYSFARGLARTLKSSFKWLNLEPCYVPGHGAYKEKPFENNPLTHSPARYQEFRRVFREHPETQLGGPTAHWVHESLLACQRAITGASAINIPLLILQAGGDSIVTPEAQHLFCDNHIQGAQVSRPVLIEGARHELLIEADRYRIPALTATLDFFGQH